MEDTPKHETIFDAEKQQLGDIYAKALLGFGAKSGNIDQLVSELEGVVDVVNQLPEFKTALESPRIAEADKAAMVEKAFGGKVSKDLVNFLKILGSKDRFDCLNALLESVKRMDDEANGRVEATVTTAAAIDSVVEKEISVQLSKVLGKTVHLTASVDPDIIGGMVVRVGDTVYDGSVASQLAQVRSQVTKNATDTIRASIDKFTSQ